MIFPFNIIIIKSSLACAHINIWPHPLGASFFFNRTFTLQDNYGLETNA